MKNHITIKELNKNKISIVKIDKKLERFRGRILFPEKLEHANEILKRTSLPKLNYNRFL